MKKTILFLCTHNSARSQIAEALLNHFHGDGYTAYSAGTMPSVVNPFSKRVLEEVGIDTSRLRSKSVKEFMNVEIDVAVTLCDGAKESCPFLPGAKKYIHKGFPDPSIYEGEGGLEAFRNTRDDIMKWLEECFSREDC